MSKTKSKSIFMQLKQVAEQNNSPVFCIIRDLLITILIIAIILIASAAYLALTSNARHRYEQGQRDMIQAYKAELTIKRNKD